jgi:hypothetical protein
MDIKAELEVIKERIYLAAQRSGRDAGAVRLLAVTKTRSIKIIREVLEAGIKFIGENKVQEAADKLPYLQDMYEEFHFIGHLQSNKVKQLLALEPALIHSVDSLHLARIIDQESAKLGRIQKILLQVNTSDEESKFGVLPSEAKRLAQAIRVLPNVKITGLMTIGRFCENENQIRSSFRELVRIGKKLTSEGIMIKWYSMGMTNDYEIAIEEGTNLLRLGTAIFGSRE